MANLNYAVEYSKSMANAYPHWSHFSDLYGSPNSATYRPVEGKTVAVQSMTVTGATAVNRDSITGAFTRNFDTTQQLLTMSMDREWSTLVDPMDIKEDPIVTIANITKVFNEFQKVPEMDAYAASKLFTAANTASRTDTTALTAANILTQWDDYIAAMVEARVPVDRIHAKVTPAVYKLLKQATGITRFLEVGNGAQGINRNVASLDGVAIESVPSDLMKTAYTWTTGWTAASGAGQINMVLFDPLAVAAPVVYDTSMMTAPTAQSKGKWLYYERYYYDVFVLAQRTNGIMVNYTAG